MQARFQKPQNNVSHLAIPPCNLHLKNNAHEIYISGRIFIKLEKFLKICKDVMLTPGDASKVFKQFNLGHTQCHEMRRF